jgi:hypothetical protein
LPDDIQSASPSPLIQMRLPVEWLHGLK